MGSNSMGGFPLKKLALSAMFVAAGVILSPILRIPGMCPMQHFINITAAVFLGPWYALLIAVLISFLRMAFFGINLLAITGSVFGAVLSGVLYRRFRTIAAAWVGEIFGTGVIGALCSYPALLLIAGTEVPSWYYYIPWFVGGTLIGGAVAFAFLCTLKKSGLLERFQHSLAATAHALRTLPCVLSIAGSDSSGGAGIQADIKAISANGCYAMTAITAVTAQNTLGVLGIQDISEGMVASQIDAVLEDIPPHAVKVGMLFRPKTIRTVAERLRSCPAPVVLDPLMVSSSGTRLLEEEAVDLLKTELIPLAYLLTPNLPEAEVLAGFPVRTEEDCRRAAEVIHAMGCANVLIKGGHSENAPVDLLYDGRAFTAFPGARIHTRNTHGTGCTLSSAIAANLAKGKGCAEAVRDAKEYISCAIAHSLDLGMGAGPTNPFYRLYLDAGVRS